jgi:hypothetical protein
VSTDQDRGSKELGFAAKVKHLGIIVSVLVLGVWWTSDTEVRFVIVTQSSTKRFLLHKALQDDYKLKLYCVDISILSSGGMVHRVYQAGSSHHF